MNSESLFTAALGLASPWQVQDIQFDLEAGRIDFKVGFTSGAKFSCPNCEASEQGVHDTRERTWRHLNFFQYQAFIHADLPRVRCTECGKTLQVKPPWSRPGSGFSLLMEALLVILAKQMPVRSIAQLLGLSDGQIWRILDHYVDAARVQEDFSSVQSVGLDETASRRGHNYISLFHDLDQRRLLFACEGRDKSVVETFVEDLETHGGNAESIDSVCIDMSKSYVAGVGDFLPNAEITFDPFHVMAIVNKAVDQVRRQEVKTEPLLKKTRYLWLRNEGNRTKRQQEHFDSLPKSRLKTARAWRIKTTLQEIYQQCETLTEAEDALKRWYGWAIRSRLEPIKEAARTIRRHFLSWFDGHLNNGGVEGTNSIIQAAKARARGYGTIRHLITMSYLVAGKLTHLPAPPFITRCCG
ncbi:MAG: ISL3 family transposase [Desulfuromusa sp.]|nr:ISL3 family transposase [Desulfuromusa sp.]